MAAERNRLLNAVARNLFGALQSAAERRDSAGAERIGERIGLLAHRLDRKHRERTVANLALAFPNESAAWHERTARGVFVHFGRVSGEFLRSRVRTNETVLAATEAEGTQERLAGLQGGLIAVTAHFGDWEWFGHWCSAVGRPIEVVARRSDDGEIEQRITSLRTATGLRVLSRGDAARGSLRALREGRVLGLLPDQNAGECFVPFFGHPAGTVMGPAVLHRRTKAPLLPAYCVRLGPGRRRVILLDPIEAGTGESDESVTARLSLALESVVREYPDQWLWMHDRWKEARHQGMLEGR
jgi:Kdo2-lipid IVA lauroyltransferase/acyltransferase